MIDYAHAKANETGTDVSKFLRILFQYAIENWKPESDEKLKELREQTTEAILFEQHDRRIRAHLKKSFFLENMKRIEHKMTTSAYVHKKDLEKFVELYKERMKATPPSSVK